MANHFYAYISRMRCVKRWALMRNTEEENIQEHSHMVAVLAHALALIRTRVFGLPTDRGGRRALPRRNGDPDRRHADAHQVL